MLAIKGYLRFWARDFEECGAVYLTTWWLHGRKSCLEDLLSWTWETTQKCVIVIDVVCTTIWAVTSTPNCYFGCITFYFLIINTKHYLTKQKMSWSKYGGDVQSVYSTGWAYWSCGEDGECCSLNFISISLPCKVVYPLFYSWKT